MLEHLSDQQLLQYKKMYEDGMSKSNRFESVKINGYDTKFLYHVVRLLDEVEQILTIGDVDLQRMREYLKSIRRGDVTEDEIRQFFSRKEKWLEQCYQDSSLPYSPDEGRIKQLLMDCLEEHFGDLSSCVVDVGAAERKLQEIKEIIGV